MQDLHELLHQRFRLPSFRRGQLEIITSVLQGKDVLAVLPTGGGKSLCFQFPAVAKEELVVVISPLIALMKDQVASLSRQGFAAGSLHSGQSDQEKREVFRHLEQSKGFLLYLSPERAQKEGFQKWIQNRRIALFAVDEAHCVSQWGHDFREEYAQLGLLKKIRPDVPVLALTASATPTVLLDISKRLGIQKAERHVHGFYRPNLYYQVEPCVDDETKIRFIHQALKQTPSGRIIIYCGTRRQTEELATSLASEFTGIGYYHAGLSSETRDRTQTAYEKGEFRILVATNAFGMGIDHPDVRLVIHYQMPANIDSLYQEMGRAGRDGLESSCLMLYAKKDKGLQSYFIQNSEAPPEIKSSRWSTLDALVNYAEGGECRHAEILTYYRDSQRLNRCGHCDTCAPDSARRIQKPTLHDREVSTTTIRRRRASRDAVEMPLDERQELRFEGLRAWRKSKAQELDVPAFVIFSDRTLKDLAVKNPQSLAALEGVYGLGAVKIEKFGPDLISQMWLMQN